MKKIAVYFGPKNVSGSGVANALLSAKIPFAMVTAEEIAAGGLKPYAAVIFPGGHSIRLSPRGVRRTVEFVEKGGGFIGICAGCQFAASIALVPVTHKIFRAAGIFDMRVVRKHPVTRGYRTSRRLGSGRPWAYCATGRVRIRYCNGGMLEPGKGVSMLVSFDEEDRLGAVVTGRRGKGRVVLISPHPESTPSRGGPDPLADYADKSRDPSELFENAVRYVMCETA